MTAARYSADTRRRRSAAMNAVRREIGLLETVLLKRHSRGDAPPDVLLAQLERCDAVRRHIEDLLAIAREVRP